MGCGESKHAIATENIISQSKRTNSKKNIEEKATTDDVLTSNTKQEESGNVVHQSGTENSIANEIDNAEKFSADGNVTGSDRSTKGDDVKKSDDQPKGESMVENVKDGDKEASPVASLGDANVKEAGKVDQILEKQDDQNPKGESVQKNDEQPKGESVVENVKGDGDKEAAPAAKSVLDDAKEGEEKKEATEENPIESNEEGGIKEKEDAKLPQPDEAKTEESGEKINSEEVVKEKESDKEIETDAKNDFTDEALEDQKKFKETGEAEAVPSAEAKDSAHNAEEKIPSAKEESEIESEEAGKKAD